MDRELRRIVVPVAILTFLLGFCAGLAGPGVYVCATGGSNVFCRSSD